MSEELEGKPRRHEVRQPAVKKKTLKRRDFFKVIGVVGVGAVVARYAWLAHENKQVAGKKILVTDTCIGCTGCAVVCPTSAILVVPGGIEASSEKCIGCGYCETACATGGIRVLRQDA